MPLFYYQTINAKGKRENSVIEAASQEQAKQQLRQQKIVVIRFSQNKKKSPLQLFSSQELSTEELLLFTTQLAELTRAKMPLFQSLTTLIEQTERERSRSIFQTLVEQIKEGHSLSEAMALYPKSFTPLYRALIKAGERVGALDKSLEKLAFLLSKATKLKKKITTALLYPFILALFSCAVILVMLLFVIPSLEMLFDQENVNRFTYFVMGTSRFLREKWHFLLLFFSTLSAAGIFFCRRPTWPAQKDRMLLRLPIYKSLLIKVAVARFTRTLASLLGGGVTIIEAIRIAKIVIQRPLLEEELKLAERKIIEGSNLSKELQKINWMPRMASQMIAIGEESGSLATMLESVAQIYEEDVDKNLSRLTELAQPIILIVMGAIVGLIMLAVLLPITDATHL